MLGELRNNSNAGSNKLYENTYYSRIGMKNPNTKLRLGFSFKSGMLVVEIAEEKEGFKYDILSSCYLTPTKAMLMYEQIQEFNNQVKEGKYKEGTAFGVNTGMGDISTVLLLHQVDKNNAVTIGKVNSEGNYISKFTFTFNKSYHFGITLSDYESMSSCKKNIYDDIELEQFTQIIKSFAYNMNGVIGYSTIDLARFDYKALSNKLNPIYDKLGIERKTYHGSSASENNFFSGNNGGFNRGTSSNTTLDDIMDDLPTED